MPCNLKNYPKDWKTIAHLIKKDANWHCQSCNKSCRRPGQNWKMFVEANSIDPGERQGRFILTVAHYPDPNPMNCDRSNLLALCSVCHLRLDAKMHGENAARTKKRKKQELLESTGQLRLF